MSAKHVNIQAAARTKVKIRRRMSSIDIFTISVSAS